LIGSLTILIFFETPSTASCVPESFSEVIFSDFYFPVVLLRLAGVCSPCSFSSQRISLLASSLVLV